MKIQKQLTNECWIGNNTKEFIIIHHTGSKPETTLEQIVNFFKRKDYISVHYVIGKDGTIVQMVDDNDRAWHAGVSEWNGKKNLNHYSIGIEILSDGYNFTQQQREACVELCRMLVKKYNIPIDNVLRHADITPGRKWDVGPDFYLKDWSSWAEFQGAILKNPKKEVIEELEKQFAEASTQVNNKLAVLNDVTKKLSEEKAIPFKKYFISR